MSIEWRVFINIIELFLASSWGVFIGYRYCEIKNSAKRRKTTAIRTLERDDLGNTKEITETIEE